MTTQLKADVEKALKMTGFAKNGGSWYRRSDEAVCVVNLQKSEYGPQYYINLGILVKRIEDKAFPKENHCHIRMRLGALSADANDLLNLNDTRYDDAERARRIRDIIADKVLPFFKSCETVDGICSAFRDEKYPALIHKEVRKLMKQSPD